MHSCHRADRTSTGATNSNLTRWNHQRNGRPEATAAARCLPNPIQRKITNPFSTAHNSHRHIAPNRFNVMMKNAKSWNQMWVAAFRVVDCRFCSFILRRWQLAINVFCHFYVGFASSWLIWFVLRWSEPLQNCSSIFIFIFSNLKMIFTSHFQCPSNQSITDRLNYRWNREYVRHLSSNGIGNTRMPTNSQSVSTLQRLRHQ